MDPTFARPGISKCKQSLIPASMIDSTQIKPLRILKIINTFVGSDEGDGSVSEMEPRLQLQIERKLSILHAKCGWREFRRAFALVATIDMVAPKSEETEGIQDRRRWNGEQPTFIVWRKREHLPETAASIAGADVASFTTYTERMTQGFLGFKKD